MHNLLRKMDKIEYTGKVYVYSSGMPADHVAFSKEKLVVPEGVPEGSIMVTVWPHYLSVAKVKRVREGSIYAPQLFNIQL
jgi:hypothetical protein